MKNNSLKRKIVVLIMLCFANTGIAFCQQNMKIDELLVYLNSSGRWLFISDNDSFFSIGCKNELSKDTFFFFNDSISRINKIEYNDKRVEYKINPNKEVNKFLNMQYDSIFCSHSHKYHSIHINYYCRGSIQIEFFLTKTYSDIILYNRQDNKLVATENCLSYNKCREIKLIKRNLIDSTSISTIHKKGILIDSAFRKVDSILSNTYYYSGLIKRVDTIVVHKINNEIMALPTGNTFRKDGTVKLYKKYLIDDWLVITTFRRRDGSIKKVTQYELSFINGIEKFYDRNNNLKKTIQVTKRHHRKRV